MSSSTQPSPRRSVRNLSVKDWIAKATTEHQIAQQKKIISFLLRTYGGLLVVIMAIFICQGFHLWGFNLSERVLLWLGGATVGAIGGLLTLTLRGVFPHR
jgi:hypothetical protein